MLLHAVFNVAAGGLAACTAYQAEVDAAFGYPRGPRVYQQRFADIVLNAAGQADPLSPDLKAAIDISNGYALAGQDYDNTSLFVLPADLTTVMWPAGAVAEELEMNDPEWADIGGP